MPNYVKDALKRLNHLQPKQPINAPSKWTPPQYGAKMQTNPINDSLPFSPEETLWLMKICGIFLYYAQTNDPTMLHMLNTLASKQTKGKKNDSESVKHFLDYCATHPNASVQYTASNMILKVHSNASYLSKPEARSRYGEFHFLGNVDNNSLNAPLLALAKIIQHVVILAAEAELAGMYYNAKEAIPLRITLEKMRHP